MSDLRLRPPRADEEQTLRAANRVMAAADDFVFALFLDEDTDWGQWLDAQARHEYDPGPGLVRGTFLLAEVDGEIVGRTSIRYELNEWLANQGGHVGYGVLPAFRRRGYAHEILRQSLVVARAHGVDPALITCDDDNAGSIATIEAAGGRPDPDRPRFAAEHGPMRRYWIH